MRNMRGSEGRRRKAGCDAGDHHGHREEFRAPKQERHDAQYCRGSGRNRQYRLVVSCEIKGNASPEGYGDPWQQASGTGLRTYPLAQFV
jgi:hypothetical protein